MFNMGQKEGKNKRVGIDQNDLQSENPIFYGFKNIMGARLKRFPAFQKLFFSISRQVKSIFNISEVNKGYLPLRRQG